MLLGILHQCLLNKLSISKRRNLDSCSENEQLQCPRPAEDVFFADEVHRLQCAGSREER